MVRVASYPCWIAMVGSCRAGPLWFDGWWFVVLDCFGWSGNYLHWISVVAAVCKQTRNALLDRRGGYIVQISGKMLSICFNFCLNRQVAYMKVIRKHYSDYLRILAFCR